MGQKYTRLCYGEVREVIAYVAILPFSAGTETLRMARLEGSAVRETEFRKHFCAGRAETSGEKMGYYLSRKKSAQFKECGNR
jgi:hypothetical protein